MVILWLWSHSNKEVHYVDPDIGLKCAEHKKGVEDKDKGWTCSIEDILFNRVR